MLVHWQQPFFVVFCRTRKICEQYYSNSYPWLYSEILELQHQLVHINVNLVILCFLFFINSVSVLCLWGVLPVGDQFLRCSHQHSNFSWIGDQWVIISSLEMHFIEKWCCVSYSVINITYPFLNAAYWCHFMIQTPKCCFWQERYKTIKLIA